MAEVDPGDLELQVIASGTHLRRFMERLGGEIVADGFSISARVEVSIATDDTEEVARSAAQVLTGVAKALVSLKQMCWCFWVIAMNYWRSASLSACPRAYCPCPWRRSY